MSQCLSASSSSWFCQVEYNVSMSQCLLQQLILLDRVQSQEPQYMAVILAVSPSKSTGRWSASWAFVLYKSISQPQFLPSQESNKVQSGSYKANNQACRIKTFKKGHSKWPLGACVAQDRWLPECQEVVNMGQNWEGYMARQWKREN